MADTKSFQCPNCGSPVSTTGAEREVKCAYCGSTVIVPEELRDHTPSIEINYGQASPINDEVLETIGTVGKVTAEVTAISVILPIALTCIILGGVGFILYTVFSNVNSSVQTVAFPTDVSSVFTQVPAFTPTPINTPAPFTKVLLKDDFTDPSSGWDKMHDSSYTLEYTSGKYHVLINKQDGGQISWPGGNYSDTSAEVDAQQTAGPNDGQFGVACRITDAGGLYSFEFSQDGSYGIYKYTNWNSDQLEEGTLSPNTISQNKINHLEGVCNGDTLTLLLNGQPLLQVQDSQYTSGGTGLVVRTGGSGQAGIDVLFSNFVVKGP